VSELIIKVCLVKKYKKYIGIVESEDSLDNLYFNRRLDATQKQRVAINCGVVFREVAFSFMAGEDFSRSIHQDVKNKTK